MAQRFEAEAFAGYRRLGAVTVVFEVFQRVWYATVSSAETINMRNIERLRIGERDFRVEFQSGERSPSRFKGLGSPPWKP